MQGGTCKPPIAKMQALDNPLEPAFSETQRCGRLLICTTFEEDSVSSALTERAAIY
jgi:hypothetical protein